MKVDQCGVKICQGRPAKVGIIKNNESDNQPFMNSQLFDPASMKRLMIPWTIIDSQPFHKYKIYDHHIFNSSYSRNAKDI